jgi:hypothetical protein
VKLIKNNIKTTYRNVKQFITKSDVKGKFKKTIPNPCAAGPIPAGGTI